MKKIFISLFLVSLLAVPVLGYAQDYTEPADLPCEITHDLSTYKGCDVDPENNAACCLVDKILTIGDWIFVGLLVIAVIIILIAAFTFLTAGGNPDKVKSARNNLIFAVVGIAVGFLAKVIVRVVASIVT